MPIICPITLLPITEAEFKQLDYAVMKHVFASHNELGRLIYELKVAAALVGEHERQVLHYRFLLDTLFGKLVNLRPASVEYRTINAVVTFEQRRRYHLVTARWRELGERCALLRATLVEVLDTFGAYLELPFYEEALTWFLGGEASVLRRIPLTRDGLTLALQPVHHLTDDIGFKLTAFTHAAEHGEGNVRRFFDLTSLRALHWLNFNRDHIQLVTFQK